MASNTLLLGPPGLSPSGVSMVRSHQAGVDNLQLDSVKPIIPQLGFPKNESFSCSNTVNPCLDLFFSALLSMPTHVLVNLLVKAWSYDPLTTLRLVCNLRGVRGTGNSDKESFYSAALLLEGEEVRENAKQEWQTRKKKKGKWLNKKMYKSKRKPQLPRDVTVSQTTKMAYVNKENERSLRKERELNKAKKAYERYCTGPMSRFLYIARRMFPRKSDPGYEGIEEAHYAFRLRDRLRKQVLVPLHKALELPELYMSSKQWDALSYNRVPSVSMKNYKKHFLWHDNQRFVGYIQDMRKEDETTAAGALLPHEIIASLKVADEVADLQWRRMVEDIKKKGELNNCIAISDVSNSMDGSPMEVCVALGLLISELCEEPWKGKLIICGSNPELHLIQGDNLCQRLSF
ncbi:uncharacterized protein LOC110421495 [Herrania umbratica]|uniref:Uncharacterized protein LOC110421495 n=1 Tax=Herrania umbratica TaxID=108875 RepID=A0A6J1AUT7_9ROSI|nr:uncharacterized protein LOC110421495 [Herrania umbratica]